MDQQEPNPSRGKKCPFTAHDLAVAAEFLSCPICGNPHTNYYICEKCHQSTGDTCFFKSARDDEQKLCHNCQRSYDYTQPFTFINTILERMKERCGNPGCKLNIPLHYMSFHHAQECYYRTLTCPLQLINGRVLFVT